MTDETSPHRYPCILMWYMLAVNWDGQVSICSVDWNNTTVVGDINLDTLNEIWNGHRMKAARLSQLEGRWGYLPVCEKCVVWAGGKDETEWLKHKKKFYEISASKVTNG